MTDTRRAAAQAAVLAIFCAVAFRATIIAMAAAVEDPDAAHALAAPAVIAALFIARRRPFAEQLGRGSWWGVALLVVSLGVYVLSTWPFNYAYPRRLTIVPALAGAVLAVGGWRWLKLSLPLLLVVLIAIPTGSRYYAFLIIKPEAYTLSAVRATLDLLPGVFVDLEGKDLLYFGAHGDGTIALGEHHRGAGLLLAYLTLGVLVTFVRIRPWWQVAALGVAAPVIVLLCNCARLLVWGLVTIFTGAGPLSPLPRMTASLAGLLLAWGMFASVAGLLSRLVVPGRPAAGGEGS